MNTNSLITIAFPVYERTTYFREALESALNQTIKVPVIVVDNCSSHTRFEEICLEHNGRVKYYRNKQNIGMFGNWNRCFELSETKYAVIVGDDDVLSHSYIEEFLKVYQTNPDLDVYYTNFFFLELREKGFELVNNNWSVPYGKTEVSALKRLSHKSQLDFPTISSIVSVNLQKSHKFETNFHAANDKLFIYTLPDNCVFYGIPLKLYLYRRHKKNDSSLISNDLTLSHCLLLLYLQHYNELSFYDKLKYYAKILNCFRNDSSLKGRLLESNSFYSTEFKKLMNNSKLPMIAIGRVALCFMLLKRFIHKWLFDSLKKNKNKLNLE